MLPEKIEYRVRPVVRYVVTRHYERTNPPEMKGIDQKDTKQIGGEHSNPDVAFEVAYALCRAEHERLGWPIDDARIQYPTRPSDGLQAGHAVDPFAAEMYHAQAKAAAAMTVLGVPVSGYTIASRLRSDP